MVAQPSAFSRPASGIAAAGTVEQITGQVVVTLQLLAPEQQQQVLDFVEFLAQKNSARPAAPSSWEKIDDRLSTVPDSAWAHVPTDGSYQHDHYLYGTPKQAP
jgi:hypothetical protein